MCCTKENSTYILFPSVLRRIEVLNLVFALPGLFFVMWSESEDLCLLVSTALLTIGQMRVELVEKRMLAIKSLVVTSLLNHDLLYL